MKIIVKSTVFNKEEIRYIRENSLRARTGIRKAFHKMGKQMTEVAKRNILYERKSGRVYFISAKGTVNYVGKMRRYKFFGKEAKVKHIASAPSQSPARITGKLIKSIGFTVRGAQQLEYGAHPIMVKSKNAAKLSSYPKYLEEGTVKMLPRPFLANSIRDNSRNNTNHLDREIFKAIVKPGTP